MKHFTKIKLSVILALVILMATAFALPVMSSAAEANQTIVTAFDGIIDYLDNVSATDMAMNGKTITQHLTEKLAAYEADPSENNLKALVEIFIDWAYGGYDASVVFYNDYVWNLIQTVEDELLALGLKDGDGDDYELHGAVKRTVDDLLDHFRRGKGDDDSQGNPTYEYISRDFFVNGVIPYDFVDGTISTQLVDGDTASKKAMNEARTASDVYEVLLDMFDFLNENCTLVGHQKLLNALAIVEIACTNTAGDADFQNDPWEDGSGDLEFWFDDTYGDVLNTLDSFGLKQYPKGGFTQYRAGSQSTSFLEDIKSYSKLASDLAFELLWSIDMGGIGVLDYLQTIPEFTIANQTWKKGSTTTADFTIPAAAGAVKAIYINGILVDPANYTVSGTKVSIKASFLETFSASVNDVFFSFENGVSQTYTFETVEDEITDIVAEGAKLTVLNADGSGATPPKGPDGTSDALIVLWAALALASATVVVISARKAKTYNR